MGQKFKIHLKNNIGGLNRRALEGNQDIRSAYDLGGIAFSQDGAISNFPGSKTTIPISQIIGVPLFKTEYLDKDGNVIPVVYTDEDSTTGRWYTANHRNGTATLIDTVTGGGQVDATQFQAKSVSQPILILTSETNKTKMWKLGDANLSDLTGWKPTYGDMPATTVNQQFTAAAPEFTIGDFVSLCATFANRPWLSGDPNNPSKAYYGALFNCFIWNNSATDVQRGGWVDIEPNDGNGPITKMIGEKATPEHVARLLVFKQRAVYAIVGDTPPDIWQTTGVGVPFKIVLLIKKHGTKSRHSVTTQSNDTAFLDQSNYLKSVQIAIKNAEAEESNVSFRVQPEFDKIPKKALPYAYIEDYERRNHLWISHFKDYAEWDEKEIADDTRALFHFNDIKDSTKNAYNLINNNNATFVTGFNQYLKDAIKLNGTNQYLSLTGGIGGALSAFTFNIWIRPQALPGNNNKAYFFHLNHTAGHADLYLFNDGGTQKLVGSIWDSNGQEQKVTEVITLTLGTWYNTAITWDGKKFRLWRDGVERGAAVSVSTIQTSGNNGLAIGSSSAIAPSDLFNGAVDELIIKTVEYTTKEIGGFYSGVSRGNNKIQIFDYRQNNWTFIEDVIYAASLLYDDFNLFSASYTGEIRKQDTGFTHNLTRRNAKYVWPWIDRGGKYFIFTKGWTTFTNHTTGTVHIEIVNANKSGRIYKIFLDKPSTGVWGEKFNSELIWSSQEGRPLTEKRFKPIGSSKRKQIKIFSFEENFAWTLIEIILEGEDFD